jgi:DNA-binding transcriptional LysR family regulator
MRLTNLDMDALRTFVVGMDAGSFVRAADRLGRSTSAVSAHLKKLEAQAGVPLLRRSGRGLSLTENGEILLTHARRLLHLNDETLAAVRGMELEGWVRLGLQEDFGEAVLPQVLGRFSRAHPKVRIEGRIARNSELTEKIASNQLDLALAWDNRGIPYGERIAAVPLRWLRSARHDTHWPIHHDQPLPIVALHTPCTLRAIACEHLDRHGIAWRLAFVSPSLAGMWAATAAGLGIALRTHIGRPASVCILDPAVHRLPSLPSLDLVLLRSAKEADPVTDRLALIIKEALRETLPNTLSEH